MVLINRDYEKIIKKYNYIKLAYEIFYKLIDDLSEDCVLCKIIQHFNNIIYEESLIKEKWIVYRLYS